LPEDSYSSPFFLIIYILLLFSVKDLAPIVIGVFSMCQGAYETWRVPNELDMLQDAKYLWSMGEMDEERDDVGTMLEGCKSSAHMILFGNTKQCIAFFRV
jgi:hypothetical protein